jgi:putative Mg2+ transporter-C (MgtC) family protein
MVDVISSIAWEPVIRLSVAALLGLIIGAERTRVGKRAGMRTYALVSMGAALFIVVSILISDEYAETFEFDPLRVMSQLVVGIGFLGAGVIFVQRQMLTGLTTAAGLWVVSGIGAAAGFGLYLIAIYATLLTLFIFEALWYFEERFVRPTDEDLESAPIFRDAKQNQHDAHVAE